ncbi:MAG: DUF2103 domain-containing protein [Haloarculaceae archaeon]
MECRRCATALERPGDYCLACDTRNADAVVLDLGAERAVITSLLDDEVVGQWVVTTVPDDGERTGVVQLRNFAGQVADEVRRKRPEEVYAAGDREVLRAVRADLHYPLYRVDEADPVEAALARRGDPALEVVDRPPAEKLGGSHTTLVGGREGRRAVLTVAGHPHVKKVVPGPIDAGGSGSRTGVRAKATRADDNGNVRLLIRDGSSVQENRVVTTAGDREMGERIRADLDEALTESGLQD